MEDVFDARATVQLAAVQSINDTGQAQTATVKTGSGAVYSDIEVIQSYGMSAKPPVDGALALLFAIGGDPANLRAILFNPSYRFGRHDAGEATLFAPDGTRVSVRAGGVIDIKGGNQINIAAPNATITATTAVNVTAPAINMTGTVTITGELLVIGGPIKQNGVIVIVP